MIKHLGDGPHVSNAIISILKYNEKLLYDLKKSYQNFYPIEEKDFRSLLISIEKNSKNSKHTYLIEILKTIKSYKCTEKPELIELLKEICVHNNQAIYTNQDKIFKYVYFDEIFRNNSMLNIDNQNGDLIIYDSNNIQYELIEYIQNHDKEFLQVQLELYVALCLGRNYDCCQELGRIFKIDTLIKYVLTDELSADLRAVLVKLITNLHIDIYPNTIIDLPNLIKVINENDFNINIEDLGTGVLGSKVKIEIGFQSQNQNKDYDRSKFVNIEDDSEREAINLTDEEKEKNKILKEFILGYLKSLNKKILDNAPSSEIYTKLTLEIVNLAGKLLKFGLLKTTMKINPLTGLFGSSMKNFGKMIGIGKEKYRIDSIPDNDSDLNKLVKYLAPLIEYDEAYFKSMKELKIKRKYESEGQDAILSFGSMFTHMKNLQKNFTNLTSLFVVEEDEKNNSIKRDKKNDNDDDKIQNEIEIDDNLFMKQADLRRVLNKFTDKSFTFKIDANIIPNEVWIKKDICKIFEYILDIRADFLMENAIEYLKLRCKNIIETPIEDDFITLVPEDMIQIGRNENELKIPEERKFKNYTQHNEIKSFDNILGKPFFETILLASYFAENSELQNSIFKLLLKCCNERKNWVEAIQTVELLHFKSQWDLRSNMLQLAKELKNLLANSQVTLKLFIICLIIV